MPNMPVGRTSLRTTSARYSRAMEAGSCEYGIVTKSLMPTSYPVSLDWKNTPERETLTEPRKSSKWSFSGSEGRMRISCVILQRRVPRRSVCVNVCFGELPAGSLFVMRSCWVAMGKSFLRIQAEHYARRVYSEEDN